MTFPNVLVLKYLKQTQQASPEIQMKAENYIALGYQRLLTFEAAGGGFSLFGSPPASLMLSAKGLLEISDMSQVYPVDPALIERTRQWLLAQQKPGGTWPTEASAWDAPPGSTDPLPLTAYVAWALLESGAKDSPGVSAAIAYIKKSAASVDDPYVLALVANALVAADPSDAAAQDALARLDRLQTAEVDGAYWGTRVGTFTGAYGIASNVETTALVAYAFLRARAYPESTQRALTYLVQKKSTSGAWGSTQATILALRALTESVFAAGETAQEATVQVSMNGAPARTLSIGRENTGVVQLVTFDDIAAGPNRVSFQVDGKGSLAYQVSAQYYLPWSYVAPTSEEQKLVDIQVAYDRTTLAVDEQVGVSVRVQLRKEGTARMTLVDLGVPPGFSVATDDLDAQVKAKTISRYELTGRQIIVYLEEFSSKQPVLFQYHLKARFPLRAKTPSSSTYDYYNPSFVSTLAPLELVVR